jgi:tetratricopeptide (TPR) repeat protein
MLTNKLRIALAFTMALGIPAGEARAGRGGFSGGGGGGGAGAGAGRSGGGNFAASSNLSIAGRGLAPSGGLSGSQFGNSGVQSFHAPTFSTPSATNFGGSSSLGNFNNSRMGSSPTTFNTGSNLGLGNRTTLGTNNLPGGVRTPTGTNAFELNKNTQLGTNNPGLNKNTQLGTNNAGLNKNTQLGTNNLSLNKNTQLGNNALKGNTLPGGGNLLTNAKPGSTNLSKLNNVNNITNINNINNINNVNKFNNFNNVNNFNKWGGGNPYWGFHQNWMHGYWNGNYNNWGWGWGGFGAGFVTGVATWGLGSALFNWGYSPYYNPYYYPPTVVVQQPIIVQQQPVAAQVYDYSQPINTQATMPEPTAADAAVASFASAREAFKAGDYAQALNLTDQALSKMPNDAALHEFRALVFFAMKQYDQAASPLYAVLSVGPGWDWTTMVGLYPNVDVYTEQLRALEAYSQEHPQSSAAHFDLAYQYMTQGHAESAAAQFKQVAQLQPDDKLSSQLAAQLTKPADGAANAQQAAAAPAAPASSVAVPAGNIVGTWTASPAQGTSIALTVNADGTFVWKVTDKGQTRQLAGEETFGNDMLTLAQKDGTPMVGKVTWQDASHFTFQAAGGGPSDPGLSFSR